MILSTPTYRTVASGLLCAFVFFISACSKAPEDKNKGSKNSTSRITPEQKEVLDKKYDSICVQANAYLDLILEDHLDPDIDLSYKDKLLAMGFKYVMQQKELHKNKQPLSILSSSASLQDRREALNDEAYLEYARSFQDCDQESQKNLGQYFKGYKKNQAAIYAELLEITLLGLDGRFSSFQPMSVNELNKAYAYGVDFQYLGNFKTKLPDSLRIKHIWNQSAVDMELLPSLFDAQIFNLAITEGSEALDEGDKKWLSISDFLKTHKLPSSRYLAYFLNSWAEKNTTLHVKGTLEGGTEFQLQLKAFEVTKSEEIPQAYGEMLGSDNQPTAYIRLKSFESQNAADDFEGILANLSEESDIKNLILDLRGNGGGYTNQGNKIISHFFEQASTLSETFYPNRAFFEFVDAEKQYLRFYRTTSEPPKVRILNLDQGINMIILVDDNTASASEMSAAILKHYKKALVVGSEPQTYGKFVGGFHRNVRWNDQAASIQLINSYILLPNGTSHQGNPKIIDVAVSHPFQTPNEELRNMNVDLSQYHFRDRPSIPRPEAAYKEELESRPDLTNFDEPAWIETDMYKQLKRADIPSPNSCMAEKWSEDVYAGDCIIDKALEYLELMQNMRAFDA